jgi:hypothetical protein
MSLERQFRIPEPIPLIQTASPSAQQIRQARQEAMSRQLIIERIANEIISRSFEQLKNKFDDWDWFISTVGIAIREKFLSSVSVYGVCGAEYVYSLTIRIDWDQYEMLDDTEELIKLDKDKPICEQIDDSIAKLLDFMKKKSMSMSVDYITAIFDWTTCSTEEEEKRRDQLTGSSIIGSDERNRIVKFAKQSHGLKVSPALLKEMSVYGRVIDRSVI